MAGVTFERQDGSSLYRASGVDWSEHYKLIGEFVAEFEKITAGLRFQYSCILQSNGLRSWPLGEFILNIESIGPAHLSRALCAACRHLFPQEAQLVKDEDAINKETVYIAERRNEIAHGEWHIGPEVVIVSDTPALPEKMGIKRKVSKEGMKVEQLPAAQAFRDLIERTRKLVIDIRNIGAKIIILEHAKSGELNAGLVEN